MGYRGLKLTLAKLPVRCADELEHHKVALTQPRACFWALLVTFETRFHK